MTINIRGVVAAIFFGCLASALFHLSAAWCVVIGIGAVPALAGVLSVFVWLLERPTVGRIERSYYRRSRIRKAKQNEKRITEARERMRARRARS